MTADVQLPQMHVFEKLKQIPLVGYACNTSAGMYNRVKLSNGLITWTLNSAEGALALTLFALAPIANRLRSPIYVIDNTLCKGIDVLQEKVPSVKEEPTQIYENAKTYVTHTRAATKMQDLTLKTWVKANEVLTSTSCGNIALSGLDTTSSIADQYIDYFLPASEGEENQHPHPSSECDDKVLHTVHTVTTISSKVGKRIYKTLSDRYSGNSQAQSNENSPTTTLASSTDSSDNEGAETSMSSTESESNVEPTAQ
ncbi:lipid storage droplets surface-binding protein 2 [Cimex lectularius]|uniref:Uncharacterized protein n=1 Tax=Cimex lectularius TaxID=79782 RepID=A0A8I6RES1_CIMLE|nr:lipid storage droplets surface-binding protein 2 [Cimex lectularius]